LKSQRPTFTYVIYNKRGGFKVISGLFCKRCSRRITEHVKNGEAENAVDIEYLCAQCAEKMRNVDIKIGEYTILEQVGKGGMSVVYRAWHEPTCRIVALKRIPPEIAVYKKIKSLFRREALIMQNLTHPHIVQLLDHKIAGEEFYFVFEYLPRGDLYTYIQKAAPSLTEICTILCQILDAVEYLHKKGFVHGDIKPYNILISRTGKGKLVDFNLARSFGEVKIPGLSQVNKTPVYMAPEEIAAAGNVGPAVDIYCMGVSMYHIFTDAFPLVIPSPDEITKAFLEEKKPADPLAVVLHHKKELVLRYTETLKEIILKGDRIPIRNYRKDLPTDLAQIIDKAVRRKEEDRFESAREMKSVLMAFLAEYKN
jgi:serine/threonine protein kinase